MLPEFVTLDQVTVLGDSETVGRLEIVLCLVVEGPEGRLAGCDFLCFRKR